MHLFKKIFIFFIILFLISGCGNRNKQMTIEDYAKIESEIDIPDPELDPARVEAITAKYGYTFSQYKEFYDKVQKNPELQEKLGEMTLRKHKTHE